MIVELTRQPETGDEATFVTALVAHARTVPSRQREAFADRLADLGESSGHIVVRTCHRVELYLTPASFRRDLPVVPEGTVQLEDVAAARHLISVACGLDSAVIGETQVLHQLRETIAQRRADRALDPILDRLFQAALRAGRIAHGWFNGAPRSLADVALDRIRGEIGDFDGRRILVVGVGRMGRLAAFAAHRRGCRVIVSNRGEDRGAALAREVGGESAAFGTLGDEQPDGVVVAISGEWRVEPHAAVELIERRIPVVDLSSPPAVPVPVQAGLGGRLISVDDLADDDNGPGERVRRKLETLISQTGRDYCLWLRSRDAVPAIQAVVEQAEGHRATEIEWLRRRLPELSTDDLALVEQMTHRLVAGILHGPVASLHRDPSSDLERAARELFGV